MDLTFAYLGSITAIPGELTSNISLMKKFINIILLMKEVFVMDCTFALFYA
jgi:hypothetical protein